MTYHIALTDLPEANAAQTAELVRLYRETFERVIPADQVVATWLAAEQEVQAQQQAASAPQLGGANSRWELAAAMAHRTALETWPGDSSNAHFEFSIAQ